MGILNDPDWPYLIGSQEPHVVEVEIAIVEVFIVDLVHLKFTAPLLSPIHRVIIHGGVIIIEKTTPVIESLSERPQQEIEMIRYLDLEVLESLKRAPIVTDLLQNSPHIPRKAPGPGRDDIESQ